MITSTVLRSLVVAVVAAVVCPNVASAAVRDADVDRAIACGLEWLATAQVARPEGAEDYSQNVFLPPDRPTLRKLSQSRLLIEEGRYGEAVRFLVDILEEPEDYFFRTEGSSPAFRSLKSEAERLIGRLPRKGRDLYELQYGAQAQRMLTDVLESGDVARLAEVSRRFFHTRGGRQATFLLGRHHFDRGRPLTGALMLQRLYEGGALVDELEPALSLTIAACWLQAGMPERARESLAALRQRDPTLRVKVAGREVPLFTDDSKAVDWLAGLIGSRSMPEPENPDSWLMFRGNASRNASTDGGVPLSNVRWRVPTTGDPFTKSALEQYQRLFAEQGNPAIPTLHPLIVGDVVLMRTLQSLLAVDFATGKQLWEAVDETAKLAPGVPAKDIQVWQWMQAAGAGQRIWGDMTYGMLSSDGHYVYSVEDLGILESGCDFSALRRIIVKGGAGLRIRVRNPQAVVRIASLCNRLTAHDIRTGKLVWELGGPAGPHALRQAETFFLGPPLPLMGRLYVLAETNGEVRLLALEAATGNLLWSQHLSLVERSVLQDPERRLAGASPSYAGGVLVCPTSTGAIVGVELASRVLLWVYCYSQDRDNRRSNRVILVPGKPSTGGWIDGSVSIRDDRVLVTPQKSDWLHCLNLIDGELLWKCPRQNDLYVACVDRDKVVLVGRSAVRALRLSDGAPAWDGHTVSLDGTHVWDNCTVSLPENSMPSGRGFLSGDQYFLPLTSAEVVGIDLAAGKITRVSKSYKGSVPGNLICHKGGIVSQGLEGADAYFQLDAVSAEVGRRLTANPNDAWALSLRGEILLNADRRSEAVASFRRAYELAPDPRTRELLRDALLEGLRTQFAAYRSRGAEVERLLDNPSQHATYLRLMAAGLRRAGQRIEAFEHYQKLVDLEPDRQPLDQIDKALIARRDRWLQGQLAGLREEAGEAAAKIDQAVAARLKSAVEAHSIEPLQRFFDYFGNQPAAQSARGELVRRLTGAGRRLEAELTAPPAEPAPRGPAEHDADWPTENVEITTAPTKKEDLAGHSYPVELRGSPGPFFRDLSIRFDHKRGMIVACDGWGRQQWQISLVKKGKRQDFPGNSPTLTHARACGHLLLISLGWKIIAIDTLGSEPDGAPRLLWIQNLAGPSPDSIDLPGPGQLPLPLLDALPRRLRQQFASLQDQSSLLGPVASRHVCLQWLRNVVAVDPRSGETLWVRQDLPSSCDVFGDDQYMFVLSSDREEATVLRALDGALLGTRKVPRSSSRRRLPNGQEQVTFGRLEATCLATLGRKLLLWRPEGNQRALTLIDPWEGCDLWPGRKFSAAACACVVDEEAVGVMEPDGRFVLVSLPDGRTLAEWKLEAEPSLRNITLFRSGDQYFLVTSSRQGSGKVPKFKPISNQSRQSIIPINRGHLYAFDQQGKLLWPAPVTITIRKVGGPKKSAQDKLLWRPTPVTIKNQVLLADQPPHLPVVIFACQHDEKKRGQWKPAVLCVDKRTGRTMYKGEFNHHTNIFHVAYDVEKKTVTLTMQKETVTLTFTNSSITNNPILPPSAADTEPTESSPGSKIAHALPKKRPLP